jgi:AcrR family transcriptional regulator
MASLRAAQKAMTRKLLLDTALEMFQAKGYASTTIDDIAAAAGTTRATFYAHFPSRLELMKAIIGELNEHLERTSSRTHGSTAPALVAVVREGDRAAIKEWLYGVASRWDTIRPFVSVAFEAAAVDPELRTLADEWLEEAVSDIAEGLDAAGRFEPQTRRLRGVLAMAQLDYVALHWREGRWNADLDGVIEVLGDSWSDLLGDRSDPQVTPAISGASIPASSAPGRPAVL